MDHPVEATLRCVPLALTLTAPTTVANIDVAQEVADALHNLERAATSEHYPARADIVLSPEQPTTQDLIRSGARPGPGHRLLVLLCLIWARRPWDENGTESTAVMVDARRTASALCSIRWRTETGAVGFPVGFSTIVKAAATGRTVKTTDPHQDLVLEEVQL